MPLLFDMPYDQLATYQGTNPRPLDFDSFWDSALGELHDLNPQIEIVPATFQTAFADCSHLFFTGVGDARIHAKLLQPRQVFEKNPAVLIFHGYSGSSGDWSSKLGYVAEGFTVAALDCRGQGGLSEDNSKVTGWTLTGHIIRGLDDGPENLLFRQIYLDAALLARIVMELPNVDSLRVGATGYSQGGGLTLACAALESRIARIAPVYPFLCDYKRVWDLDLDVESYTELREYFRHFDPRHLKENDVFTRLGYIDVQYLASRIKAQVFFGVGLMDTICPPSTQFAAFNKILSEKSLAIYPDHGHEDLPGHNDLIFQFMREI